MSKKRKKRAGKRKSAKTQGDDTKGKSATEHPDDLRKKASSSQPTFRYAMERVVPARPSFSQIAVCFIVLMTLLGWCAFLLFIA